MREGTTPPDHRHSGRQTATSSPPDPLHRCIGFEKISRHRARFVRAALRSMRSWREPRGRSHSRRSPRSPRCWGSRCPRSARGSVGTGSPCPPEREGKHRRYSVDEVDQLRARPRRDHQGSQRPGGRGDRASFGHRGPAADRAARPVPRRLDASGPVRICARPSPRAPSSSASSTRSATWPCPRCARWAAAGRPGCATPRTSTSPPKR